MRKPTCTCVKERNKKKIITGTTIEIMPSRGIMKTSSDKYHANRVGLISCINGFYTSMNLSLMSVLVRGSAKVPLAKWALHFFALMHSFDMLLEVMMNFK